jgi:hypothetical protein
MRNDSRRSADRIEPSAPRPQLSDDAPAFPRITEEALLRLEEGQCPVRAASAHIGPPLTMQAAPSTWMRLVNRSKASLHLLSLL